MKKCNKCGKIINDNSVFCNSCGQTKNAVNLNNPQPIKLADKKVTGGIIILWIICVYFIISGLSLLLELKIISSLFCFMLGLFTCPKAKNIIYKFTKKQLNKSVQIIICIILFIIAPLTTGINNKDNKTVPAIVDEVTSQALETTKSENLQTTNPVTSLTTIETTTTPKQTTTTKETTTPIITTTFLLTTTPVPVTEPPATEAPKITAAPQEIKHYVYVAASGSGKKYHSDPNCSNMDGIIELTISEAEAQGYSPCKKCN